jgi:hypothetical protein
MTDRALIQLRLLDLAARTRQALLVLELVDSSLDIEPLSRL